MIPHNKPLFDVADQLAVTKALQSGYVAQGSEVTHLEQELSTYIGAYKSILVNSGTTAIYLALHSLNVHKDDEVILPTYVCSALLNAIFMIGAKPRLVDVNEEDFNINWDMVACNVTNRTKAIIVPHIHGMPSFIPGNTFMGCPIIEDCATALGSYISIGDSLIHVGGGVKPM